MTHFNGLTPAEAERLALLLEEMGEAQQVIGKILRHGFESVHPDGGETNRQSLQREVGDVRAAMEMMFESNDLDRCAVGMHSDVKRAKVGLYLHHQDNLSNHGK